MKDKNWLNKELDKSITGFNGRELSRYEMGRLDGYTHASILLDELDEPEKPVIPKFVAEWIEEIKKQGKSLVFAITHIYYKNEIGKSPNKEEKRIFLWMELADNEEVFARAWLDGFTVEEEQKYYVLDKEDATLLKKTAREGVAKSVGTKIYNAKSWKDEEKYQLTEQEIKEYDERYWAFAQEVTE